SEMVAATTTACPEWSSHWGNRMQNLAVVKTNHPALEHHPRVLTVPLLDREREVAELRTALDAALGGSGRVALLGGEPGIGKTRLARVIADEAGARGVPVWGARGWEDGSVPAFWVWNTALRRWLDQVGPDPVAAAAGTWGAELAHVFPILRERLPDLPPSGRWESDGARSRLFDLVSRFLAAVARPDGLVVVLDDVQWSDRPSLKLLEFLASDLAGTRLLVIATYRDTEVEREHPFFATLARLASGPTTRRLPGGGLAPAHCARWLALLGTPGDAAALGEALHRETNGNPFFVGELVRLLTDEERLAEDWDALRVPHGVREVIARRLDRLGAGCRATLGAAALVGDTIEAGLLADILGDTPPADHLEQAVHDKILVEGEGCSGRYAFAHALIRRVLVDELAPSTRATWHARIATVLEHHTAASEVVTTELVHHLAAAGTATALRKAVDYACQGADQAAPGLGRGGAPLRDRARPGRAVEAARRDTHDRVAARAGAGVARRGRRPRGTSVLRGGDGGLPSQPRSGRVRARVPGLCRTPPGVGTNRARRAGGSRRRLSFGR